MSLEGESIKASKHSRKVRASARKRFRNYLNRVAKIQRHEKELQRKEATMTANAKRS